MLQIWCDSDKKWKFPDKNHFKCPVGHHEPVTSGAGIGSVLGAGAVSVMPEEPLSIRDKHRGKKKPSNQSRMFWCGAPARVTGARGHGKWVVGMGPVASAYWLNTH